MSSEQINERNIRREERFDAILGQVWRAKRHLRETQEQEGLPVHYVADKKTNTIKYKGIWCTGQRTQTHVNWHYLPFDAVSLEFNITYPTMIVETPWNMLCWMIKDDKPAVVLDPSLV